jgi:pyruvate/2-oxoacid:ferredoxin oxidoreductase beta subunit
MILNSYHDSGGLDSKKDVEAMKKLLQDLNIKRNRFIKESAEKIDNPVLLSEIKDISSEIEDYQSRLSSIFERSAESIAERRLIQWCTLNLLFVKENETFKIDIMK